MNCRIQGLEKKSPDLIIIDRNLKLKRKLKIFDTKRKGIIFTQRQDKSKSSYFKKKGLRTIVLDSLSTRYDYEKLFFILKKKYSRIFVESGLTFTKFLLNNNFLNNLYIFQSDKILSKNGLNNLDSNFLKKIKNKKLIKVNLLEDKLFEVNFR